VLLAPVLHTILFMYAAEWNFNLSNQWAELHSVHCRGRHCYYNVLPFLTPCLFIARAGGSRRGAKGAGAPCSFSPARRGWGEGRQGGCKLGKGEGWPGRGDRWAERPPARSPAAGWWRATAAFRFRVAGAPMATGPR